MLVMPRIIQRADLTCFNTFKISAQADLFLRLKNAADITKLREFSSGERVLVLGEGANILFTKNFQGLVVKNDLTGKGIVSQNADTVTLRIASGENWHKVVMWAVKNNWSGIENLAYIPGTVGGAPVQNIAAYGQNFEDVFVYLDGINLETGRRERYQKTDCQFGYRESLFKKTLQGKFFVTEVVIKLSKKPQGNASYHELRVMHFSLIDELKKAGKKEPFLPADIARVVIGMRKVKQPDWHKVGTAGSFFKNPIVSRKVLDNLKKQLTDLQFYPVEKLIYTTFDDQNQIDNDMVKIPAARLLDELGWRGRKIGRVATFSNQALAVVNLGGATGKEILEFSNLMKQDVLSRYGIELEPEVIVI